MVRPNIVTFYNSLNCGAFLQGFALGEVLRELTGCAPRYVETGARRGKIRVLGSLKRAVKSCNPALFGFERKKSAAYVAVLSDYEVVGADSQFTDDDLLVFGSDEIWNVARKAITDYPALWGEGISGGGARVSYAPTANGANFEEASCVESFKRGLEAFDLLAARDHVAQNSVHELTGRDVEVVCDPTLLLTKDVYRKFQKDPEVAGYVLVYSYGSKMTKEDVDDIREFAHAKGLKLVSGGNFLPWCDVSLPTDPFEFLGLMDAAEYVITDTFHGTVFASIYHKKYASYARANSKVVEFMKGYCLEDRMVGDDYGLSVCLGEAPDYIAFDERWSQMRESSLDYLRRAVALCAKGDERRAENSALVSEGASLREMTTFRMGGKAARLWEPKRGDDLRCLPKSPNGYRIISGGSNLLVSERTFTDVISMKCYDQTVENHGDGRYRVGASVRIQKLITTINADGYGGIEELVSIPGMLGGLICMNASVPSSNTCISDYLVSVEVFDGERVLKLGKSDCAFGYRSSLFQNRGMIVLGAEFQFPAQSDVISAAKIDARKKRCREMQDNSAPNFGTVFAFKSGKAMSLVRRRGLAQGGISFSKKTGNWLLNNGGTFEDAMCLLERVKRINRCFGKRARFEVRVWK